MKKIYEEISLNQKDELIVNSAINIFVKKGFDKATMDEIVQEAGIGKGTIYRRIGNKEKLEKFVIKQMGLLMFNKIKKKIRKNNNPLLQLKEIINIMCDFFDDNSQVAMLFYSKLFFNLKQPNTVTSWPPIAGLKTDNLFENILRKAIKEKQIKNINIEGFLKGFTYFCNPFYYNFLKETLKLSKSEISVFISEFIINGIGQKRSAINSKTKI